MVVNAAGQSGYPRNMRVFISYSSEDRTTAEATSAELNPAIVWVDRAEIRPGDIILEELARGIEQATDFLLLWSKYSSKSQWVRLELNMALIRWIEQKGCTLRIVLLDNTPLPLYLRPFLYLDVSQNIANAPRAIASRLLEELWQPRLAARRPFVDRFDELERIQLALDSQQFGGLFLHGLSGIGKRTLVIRAVENLYAGADLRTVDVRAGTGWVELALQMCAITGIAPPVEGEHKDAIREKVRRAIDDTQAKGVVLTFFDVQHWIDDEGFPTEILSNILSWCGQLPSLRTRPIFLTSTRMARMSPSEQTAIQTIRVGGIPREHMAALIRHWLALEAGNHTLNQVTALKLAAELHGYPLAGRLAASLVAQFGADGLLKSPSEIVQLRIDLAKDLIAQTKPSENGNRILRALAAVDTPVPSSRLAQALALSEDSFKDGVDNLLQYGLLEPSGTGLVIHPLVQDFYWRQSVRELDHDETIQKLAEETRGYLSSLRPGSLEFARILPTVFRLLALSGQLNAARALRSDLAGTLLESGIQLYHQRKYEQALQYMNLVLESDPPNWDARLFKARSLSRLGRPSEAEPILLAMLSERPKSIRTLHELGRARMAAEDWRGGLEWFAQALAIRRDDLPSLRDTAECFLRLGDLANAEAMISRARAREPRNLYVLVLESQILEEKGDLTSAYAAIERARQQEPANAALAHRMGRIAELKGDLQTALRHYYEALDLDPQFIESRLSAASVLVDMANIKDARHQIDVVRNQVVGRDVAVLRGLEAKLLFAQGLLDDAWKVLNGDRSAHAYGLRALIELKRGQDLVARGYSEPGVQARKRASAIVEEGLKLHPSNRKLQEIEQRVKSSFGTG